MRYGLLLLLFWMTLGQALVGASDKAPWERWEAGVEAGYLVQVGDDTPIDYELGLVEWVVRGPMHFQLWEGEAGARLVVRPRFALITEAVLEGPEDLYVGFSAAPVLEFWPAVGSRAWYAAAGGGAGFINSGDVEGGQGQDFTLNWFAQAGVRQQLRPQLDGLAAVTFQHMSNGGQTDPNPGIDALGVTLGLIYRW